MNPWQNARSTAFTAAFAAAMGAAMLAAAAQAVAAQPDLQRGAAIYERCVACHAFEYDRTGPRHCGLFGRHAGSVKGFTYSDAMRRADIVWNAQTLDVFLKSPITAVPGTSMGYAGVTDAGERADLIAYMKRENAAPRCQK